MSETLTTLLWGQTFINPLLFPHCKLRNFLTDGEEGGELQDNPFD